VVLGVGFFIKSSSLLFLASGFLIVITDAVSSKKIRLLNCLVIAILSFLAVIFFLLINPQFWQTLPSNSRYSLTLGDLLAFPLSYWGNNVMVNIQISLVYLTPLLFLVSVLGIAYILRKKQKTQILYLAFFMLPLLGTTLLARIPSDRYLVSFLPFAVIPAAYLLWQSVKKQRVLGILLSLVVFSIPFSLTLLQLINPPLYLIKTFPYAPSVNPTYLQGVTAGYGINETVDYLKSLAQNKAIIVGIAENTGNPESALITYFNQSENIKVVYFSPDQFAVNISGYDCISIDSPLYFVTRDEQLPGLGKFMQKIKTIRNPYGKNTIGIYALKKGCVGKTLVLHMTST
jgi:hypothetical protein